MSFDWLPKVLAEIAEVAGLDAALQLAEARGGVPIYIPARVDDGHWLVGAVGREAADAICRHFAFSAEDLGHHGVEITLPAGPLGGAAKARARADRMIAEGRSITEVARATGYTSRGVERRRAKHRQRDRGDGRQGRLF